MADISVVRPQAGQNVILEQAPGNRLVFAFPPDAISMERVNDDMVLRFEDGGTVTLQNFYTAYTSETLPDIVIDGQTIGGDQFIAAFGDETLMPAAGPAAASAPSGQGSSSSFGDVSFLGGINRLDGLDISYNDGPIETERLDTAGLLTEDPAAPSNIAPTLTVGGSVLDVVESGVKNINGDPNAAFAGNPVSVTGQLTAADPDNSSGGLSFYLQAGEGQSLTESVNEAGQTLQTLTTDYGTLTLNLATGTYVFTLHNTSDATQGLMEGQRLTLDFTAGVRDGLGATTSAPITVTITGTNDRPELSVSTTTINLSEDASASSGDGGSSLTTTVMGNGNIAVSGKFDVADADADGTLGTGQTITINGYSHSNSGPGGSSITNQDNADAPGESSSLETTYGKFSIDPVTGEYTYELYNGQNGDGNSAVQQLSLGQTITETFTIRTTDEHGAWHEQTITVTVTGTNDGPLLNIGAPDHAILQENGANQVAKGDLTVKDVDNDGTMGQQTGGKANQSFSVNGETIGIDGKPSGTSQSTTDEFGNATIKTAYGTLVIKVDGTYEYTLDSDADAVQQLGTGESITEEFTVTVTDAHGATDTKTITLKVEGTNDAPVIKHTSVEVKESGVHNGNAATEGLDPNTGTFVDPAHHKLVVDGKLTATDADKNDELRFDITGLKDLTGNKPSDSISATVEQEDGGTRQMELKFENTDHAEGEMGDKAFLVTNADGTVLGRLTLDSATGEFRFTLNDTADINGLAQGETLRFSFVTTATDSHGATGDHMLGIIVRGTNDAPQLNIDAPDNAVLTENGANQVAKGTLTVADVDSDGTMGQQTGGKANQSFSVNGETIGIDGKPSGTSQSTTDEFGNATIKTAYGTLVIKVDGTYEYTLDSDADAVQQLGTGESITEEFTVTVTDAHGATDTKTITLKVDGTNDAPLVKYSGVEVKESGVHNGNAATEGLDPNTGTFVDPAHHKLVVDGKLTATDADKNDSMTFDIKGLKDTTSNNIVNSVSATVTQEDGSTRQMELKFENTDHAEGEMGDKTFLVTNADGTVLGRLTLDSATGEFRFTLSDTADINGLAEGETLRFNFVTTATDSHGATGNHMLGIIVRGTNDAPQMDMTGEAVANRVLTAYENGVLGSRDPNAPNDAFDANANSDLKGNVSAKDVDHGDTLTYSLDKGLKVGDSLTTSDDHGAKVDVTITGIKAEGGWQIVETNFGTFRLNTSNGDVTFSPLEGKNSPFNSLSEGSSLSFNFGVTATDKHGATAETDVTINLVGTNDRPTLSLNTKGSLIEAGGNEAGNYAITGTAIGKDVDNDNQGAQGQNGLTYSFFVGGKEYTAESFGENVSAEVTVTLDGQSFTGTFTLNSQTGKYSFTVNESDRDAFNEMFNSLAQDKTLTLKDLATIRVTDSNGSFTDQNLNVTVKGTNDAPTVGGNEGSSWTETVAEDGGKDITTGDTNFQETITQSGKLEAHDVDNSDLKFHLVDKEGSNDLNSVMKHSIEVDGETVEIGYITLNSDGSYTYTLFNDNPYVQQLAQDQKLPGDATFWVRVSDGNGGVLYKEMTVNVTGTNDAPHVEDSKSTVKEDGGEVSTGSQEAVTSSGKVNFSDIDDKEVENYKVILKGEEGDTIRTDSDAKGSYTEMDGEHGTIRLYGDGEYTYTLRSDLNNDPNFQSTHKDDLFNSEKFDFILSTGVGEQLPDGTGSTAGSITVDIVGTNDAPVITTKGGFADTSGVKHDNATETGKIAATDIDKTDGDDLHFRVMQKYENGKPADDSFTDTKEPQADSPWEAEQSVNGTYGTLTITPDGSYTYTLDIFSKAVQDKLAQDPNFKFEEKFDVTVTDHHGATHTVQLPVEASWEKPNGGGSGSGSGGGQGHDYAFTGITVGSIALVESGSTQPGFEAKLVAKGQLEVDYTCTRPEHQQGQGQGHEKGEGDFFFAFRNADGEMVQSVSDAYGTLTINPITGEYTYTLNDASQNVQQLPAGHTVGLNFPVYVVNANGEMLDAKGQVVTNPDQAFTGTISGTVTGTNDAPILDKVDSIEVDADNTTDSGNVAKGHDTDKAQGEDGKLSDAQEAVSYNYYYNGSQIMPGSSVTTEFGTFTLNADGTYAYVLATSSDAFKGLAQGETGYDKGFSVVATDGKDNSPAKDISIKITGENDAPTLSVSEITADAKDLFTVTEDGVGKVEGQLSGVDVDGDKLTYSMSLKADGSQSSGYLVKGAYGTMVLNPTSGKFEYILNNANDAVQKLGSGDTVTETVYMTVKDGKGGSHTEAVEVTIKGSNDAAEITFGKNSGTLTEDKGSQTVDLGQIEITDIDTSDTHTITVRFGDGDGKTLTYKTGDSIEVAGKYGTLTVNADGTYSYKLTSDELGAGQKATEEFNIVVKELNSKGEQQGEGISQNVSIGLTGSNDKAGVDFNVTHGSVAEGDNLGSAAAIGAVTIADLDATDYHKITVSFGDTSETLTYKTGGSIEVAGKYGTLTLNPDGTYSYTLTNESLGEGVKGNDIFHITVEEFNAAHASQGSQSQDVVIEVTGQNNAPALLESSVLDHSALLTDEGFDGIFSGHADGHDVDADDTLTYAFSYKGEALEFGKEYPADYGTITVNEDGSYTYTVTPGLETDAADRVDDNLLVQVSDNSATAEEQITITLQGETQQGDAKTLGLLTDADNGKDTSDPLLLSDVMENDAENEMDSLLAALGDTGGQQEQQPAAAPAATEAADTGHTGLDASMYDQYLVGTAAQSNDDLPSAEKIAMDTIAHHGS